MISTVKREIAIEKELRSKIEWACTFSNCEPKIKNGNLRMVEKTNIAYVEPHSVVIKGKLYLFFNEHEYFYIGNLANYKNCPVRYMPQRKKTQYYDGTRYVTRCEKDRKAHEDAILKRRLP